MFKKVTKYIKLVPLILLGVAVIVWTSVFRRDTGDAGNYGGAQKGDEPPVFPY